MKTKILDLKTGLMLYLKGAIYKSRRDAFSMASNHRAMGYGALAKKIKLNGKIFYGIYVSNVKRR